QHVAIAGAVQLAQIVSQRQRDRRQGAEMLAQLLDPQRSWRVAMVQPDVASPDLAASVLLVLRVTQPGAEDALHPACSRSHIASVLLRRDDLLYAIMPEAAVAGLSPQATVLSGQPGQQGSRVGVSDVVGSADRTPDAGQEALWALGIAEANAIPLVRYGDG